MSNKKLQELLDDLEDAQEDVKRYHRILLVGISGAIISVLLIVFGVLIAVWGSINSVDTAGYVAGFISFGVFGATCAGVPTCIFYSDHNGREDRQLKQAQRAYRDYLVEEV